MNFVILHGTLGSPNDNWYPWLTTEIENKRHTTFRPQLPTPEGQTLENWVKIIRQTLISLDQPSNETVIVAHSMSTLAVCHYLASLHDAIKACYFIAGFADRLPNTPDPYPTLNNPFIDSPINWAHVKENCEFFTCFASDNDPYVPFDIAMNFAKRLSAEFIKVPGAGHFNVSSGYKEFPLLLETMQRRVLNDTDI